MVIFKPLLLFISRAKKDIFFILKIKLFLIKQAYVFFPPICTRH